MGKIEINTENVVIGSRTLIEYKFQVLNFMNLIYDCIENLKKKPQDLKEINRSKEPWFNNLTFEIQRVRDGINDQTRWTEYLLLIESLGTTISNGDLKCARKKWKELLSFLTENLELKKEIEFIVLP